MVAIWSEKKISFFYFVYKHPYFDSFQPCIWTKSRIFLLLDILLQHFFSNNLLKCILSLFISQHHKIDKVSFDTSEISLLMMLSFWTCYQSFLDTYWHFNLLASEVKPSVLVYSIKMMSNIFHAGRNNFRTEIGCVLITQQNLQKFEFQFLLWLAYQRSKNSCKR